MIKMDGCDNPLDFDVTTAAGRMQAAEWRIDGVTYWHRIELPVITQQPRGGTIYVGDSVTLTCNADANHGALAYHWYDADKNVLLHTGSSYPRTYTNKGNYRIKCIVQNERGDATSATATIKVVAVAHELHADRFVSVSCPGTMLYGFAWPRLIQNNAGSYGVRGSIVPAVTCDGKQIECFYAGPEGLSIFIRDGGNNYDIYYRNEKLAVTYTDVSHNLTDSYTNGKYYFASKNNSKNKILFNAIYRHDGAVIKDIEIRRK